MAELPNSISMSLECITKYNVYQTVSSHFMYSFSVCVCRVRSDWTSTYLDVSPRRMKSKVSYHLAGGSIARRSHGRGEMKPRLLASLSVIVQPTSGVRPYSVAHCEKNGFISTCEKSVICGLRSSLAKWGFKTVDGSNSIRTMTSKENLYLFKTIGFSSAETLSPHHHSTTYVTSVPVSSPALTHASTASVCMESGLLFV